MATRDNVSDHVVVMVMNRLINTNNEFFSFTIDTIDFDMGIMFSSVLVEHTDGLYTLSIGESDDSGGANETVVGPEKIIGSLPILTVQTGQGGLWKVFGVHSTKRFLRITVTSTDVAMGARIVIVATLKGEYSPQLRV